MAEQLRDTGLIPDVLFAVDGELVEHYNRALERVTGKRTARTSFRIDKRGESPELEQVFGPNYLQCGPANRYMIIVSPSQKRAGLIHEEFSFDDALFDLLYDQHLPGIDVVTRVDSLYGELSNRISSYQSLEDLLMLEEVSIRLTTPSGFIDRVRELNLRVGELEADPGLLTADDSATLRHILELVQQVGDVRGHNLTDIGVTKDIGAFYSRMFDGVYVFRPDAGADHALVVYAGENEAPEDGPTVAFVPLSATDRVVRCLIARGYARLAPELLAPRQQRLEDHVLLAAGVDVARLGHSDRQQAVNAHLSAMPEAWHGLGRIRRGLAKGINFAALVEDAGVEAQGMLLACESGEHVPERVVRNLLTKLWPADYEQLYEHNLRDLEHIFAGAPDALTRDYIVAVLRKQEGRARTGRGADGA